MATLPLITGVKKKEKVSEALLRSPRVPVVIFTLNYGDRKKKELLTEWYDSADKLADFTLNEVSLDKTRPLNKGYFGAESTEPPFYP